MPVLESPETIHAETRVGELLAVRALLLTQLEAVLAVRIGATDLCGLFGLRRSNDQTVYDLTVIRDAIADIVNVFGRDDNFAVSGPVWEYFERGERIFKPQLRESPFRGRDDLPNAVSVRRQLVSSDLDGLLREVVLDKATGILGKTVIHPSHVRPVHAMLVVTAEEYSDALATLCLTDGGVGSSVYANKMIESKPHARWAAGIMRRAAVFGVLRPDRTFVDLLDLEDVGA
jgi:citrate lyase beta subunit